MIQNHIDIGQRIKTLRTQKEIKQKDFAILLGVSAPAVNKWEKGENTPDIYTLQKIASVLGVSLYKLIEEPSPAAEAADQPTDTVPKTKNWFRVHKKLLIGVAGVIILFSVCYFGWSLYRNSLVNVRLIAVNENTFSVYGRVHQTSYFFSGPLSEEEVNELCDVFLETQIANGCLGPPCDVYEFRFFDDEHPADWDKWVYDVLILKE